MSIHKELPCILCAVLCWDFWSVCHAESAMYVCSQFHARAYYWDTLKTSHYTLSMSIHLPWKRGFSVENRSLAEFQISYTTRSKIFTAIDPFSNHFKMNRKRQYLEARIKSGFTFTSPAPTVSFSLKKNVALWPAKNKITLWGYLCLYLLTAKCCLMQKGKE